MMTANNALDAKKREIMEKDEELKIAEDEIDELKKLLNVAKNIRKKSVANMKLTKEEEKAQDAEVPDGCKQS